MIEVRPVDADRWDDLAQLFGPSGAYSGCWCMWFRIPGAEFSRNGNAGNRAALQSLVAGGEAVGLLGYAAGQLDAAVTHARAAGAGALEGYPVDTSSGRMPPAAELYTGTVTLFTRAGFEVHRRPATGRRVLMRHPL